VFDIRKFIRPPAILLVLTLTSFVITGCAAPAQRPEHTARNRNFYQIFVGSFRDSDGDGIGDLLGIVEKLDYLSETLGVQGIWLTPIHPSPTYHKYDVMDYFAIDPDFGTMEDFELLIYEANARNIVIILDFVINHTSSQHPWFLAALEEIRTGAEPFYKDFYVFVEQPSGSGYYPTYNDLFYHAHFWSEMPDLNLDNEYLREEIRNIARFWLDKGVSGFRLDAVPHIFPSQQAKNIEFWTWFKDMCREIYEDVFLVGEVWSHRQEILPYFATGMSFFNFPFAGHDGIINVHLRSRDGAGLAAEIERFDAEIRAINPDAVNSIFLSNHDTGRSAGWLIEPNRQRLAAAIYLLIPGNPFIYYGEEIGMFGSGVDPNLRAGMFWSTTDSTGIPDNPPGSGDVRPPDYGVAEQLDDPSSLLNYYRAILALKAEHQDIFDSIALKVEVESRYIAAIRTGNVIVMHNLSDEPVSVSLDVLAVSLAGYVSPTGESATESDSVLTLPPYSSAVLR